MNQPLSELLTESLILCRSQVRSSTPLFVLNILAPDFCNSQHSLTSFLHRARNGAFNSLCRFEGKCEGDLGFGWEVCACLQPMIDPLAFIWAYTIPEHKIKLLTGEVGRPAGSYLAPPAPCGRPHPHRSERALTQRSSALAGNKHGSTAFYTDIKTSVRIPM